MHDCCVHTNEPSCWRNAQSFKQHVVVKVPSVYLVVTMVVSCFVVLSKSDKSGLCCPALDNRPLVFSSEVGIQRKVVFSLRTDGCNDWLDMKPRVIHTSESLTERLSIICCFSPFHHFFFCQFVFLSCPLTSA